MNDFIDSVDSEEKAIQLALQVKTIHTHGSFHMRNWTSNSVLVRQKLSEDESLNQNSFGTIERSWVCNDNPIMTFLSTI